MADIMETQEDGAYEEAEDEVQEVRAHTKADVPWVLGPLPLLEEKFDPGVTRQIIAGQTWLHVAKEIHQPKNFLAFYVFESFSWFFLLPLIRNANINRKSALFPPVLCSLNYTLNYTSRITVEMN